MRRRRTKENLHRGESTLRFERLEQRRLLCGLNIAIEAGPGLVSNNAAMAAAERSAQAWEAVLCDPITVRVEIDLTSNLPPGVAGGTASEIEDHDFDSIRAALIADAADEPDDALVGFLPTASEFQASLPPGFSLGFSAGENPNGLDLNATRAALKAMGFVAPNAPELDGLIVFSTAVSYDFDNTDGVPVGVADFETIITHELGHILGFSSIVNDIDQLIELNDPGIVRPRLLDLFRFNESLDSNPETLSEFTTATRWLQTGGNTVSNFLDTSYPMSTGFFTGDGFQAGHWQDDSLAGEPVGLMDPGGVRFDAIPPQDSDLRALDLIGYEVLTDDPPVVTSLRTNVGIVDPLDRALGPQPTRWDLQRSDLRSIVVHFSEPVEVNADDIRLTHLGVDANNDPEAFIPVSADQLQFVGNELTISFAHDSLPEGSFRLELLPGILNADSESLDGDADGTAGGIYHVEPSAANGLLRLAGDFNGDLGVSIFDFPVIAYWFGFSTDFAPRYADLNNDQGVSIFDFPRFSENFGNEIIFPVGFSPSATGVHNPDTAPVDGRVGKPRRELEQEDQVDIRSLVANNDVIRGISPISTLRWYEKGERARLSFIDELFAGWSKLEIPGDLEILE